MRNHVNNPNRKRISNRNKGKQMKQVVVEAAAENKVKVIG